ncbi:hypothetical protein O181_039989 [Austropuccinia psidii MF-1]|uniref:Uncharacterized protein n=1 Tax=Austropuccinia psidii MF-1 TaxID=1389203 RepID=A0A9Q3HF26_9BASI|nr:hypothetical protein [Austropuccinia psidii MF-1]
MLHRRIYECTIRYSDKNQDWKNLEKVDIKSPNKFFIKKDKSREPFKPNTPNSNEKREFHKWGGIGHLANNFLKKAKIGEIVETEDHNDKKEESETSKSYEINIVNAQINNIDLIYEVLDVKSNLPQVGTSDTSLKTYKMLNCIEPNQQKEWDLQLESQVFTVENHKEKVNLDTVAYCTCVGKGYLKSIIQDWEEKLIPIQGVKFSSSSESMKPLGMIYLTLIFPHHSQCIRVKVEFVVKDNCTSNHFILGNDYFSIYGIDISNQKDRYFTIGDNKRQKFGFLNNKKQITAIKKKKRKTQKKTLS